MLVTGMCPVTREQAERAGLTSITETQNTLGLNFFPRKRGKSLSDCPLTQPTRYSGKRHTVQSTSVTRTRVLCAQVFPKILLQQFWRSCPPGIILHCAPLSCLRWYGYLAISVALPKPHKQFSLSCRLVNQGNKGFRRLTKIFSFKALTAAIN